MHVFLTWAETTYFLLISFREVDEPFLFIFHKNNEPEADIQYDKFQCEQVKVWQSYKQLKTRVYGGMHWAS